MGRQVWIDTLNRLNELGWQPSPTVLEFAYGHVESSIEGFDFGRKITWYKKLYYKLCRFIDEVWNYRFGNPRWYKRKWTLLTKGYDPSDCWSLDHSFCKWIVPRLKHLKENKMGVPGAFVKGDSDEAFAQGEKEWDAVLDKMIWAFEFYQHDLAEMCDENGPQWQAFHEGFYAFKLYFGALWD